MCRVQASKMGQVSRSIRSPIVVYKRSWRDFFRLIFTKKEKRTKKERRSVETAPAVEIDKGCLRRFPLRISTSGLKKPPHKTLRLFHSFNRLEHSETEPLPLPPAEANRKPGIGTYTKFRTPPA